MAICSNRLFKKKRRNCGKSVFELRCERLCSCAQLSWVTHGLSAIGVKTISSFPWAGWGLPSVDSLIVCIHALWQGYPALTHS